MSKFSITGVIPVHNHEQWILQAIQSLLEQTYPVDRIVVIDDGSSDNSFGIVYNKLYKPKEVRGEAHGVCGKFPNFPTEIYLYQLKKAMGPSMARNLAIKCFAEHSDLFAFLDSDDWYQRDKVEQSIKLFDSELKEVGVVYSDFTTHSIDTGQKTRVWKEPYSRGRLLQECIINNDSVVSKRALVAIGGYDIEMRVCEDYDLWLRLTEQFIALHIPESLVNIRVGKHSATDVISKEMWQNNYQKVFQKAKQRGTI